MQKGFGVIYILIGILVLGLVAGGAYYIGKSSSTPQPLSQSPTSTLPIKVDKNAPTDQTANWKTYTDSKYGYSINYPASWIVRQESYPQRTTFHPIPASNPTESAKFFYVSVMVTKSIKFNQQDVNNFGPYDYKNIQRDNLTFSVFAWNSQYGNAGLTLEESQIVAKNAKEILSNMLSTFKFTN